MLALATIMMAAFLFHAVFNDDVDDDDDHQGGMMVPVSVPT